MPFFEVLDQEQAALHGGATTNFSWDFAPDHFKDSTGLLAKIKPLFPEDERAQLPETAHHETLAKWLNQLLHSPVCLYKNRDFPKAGLKNETVAMTKLELDSSELSRLNRLLLEEAFPEHLKKISDLHLAGIYRRIHAGAGSTALCFSGGGIRSATFALGVTQGLARQGLLKHFDYLSTVSGGGYIGSWLSSWIHRAGGVDAVTEKLSGGQPESITEPEPGPLNHLRKYSNYLTPKLGLFSADTWVLIATYLRNLALNWLVFVPLLLALLALPRVHVSLLNLAPSDHVTAGVFAAGFLLVVVGLAYSALSRPAVQDDLQRHGGAWFGRRDQKNFLLWCFAPLCGAAFCITTAWSWTQNGVDIQTSNGLLRWFLEILRGKAGAGPRLLDFCLGGAALHLAGWLLAETFMKRWLDGKRAVLGKELAMVIIAGAVGGAFVWNAATLYDPRSSSLLLSALYSSLAAPLFLLLFLLAAIIFIGVSSRVTSDDDREWWARMGAWMLIAIVGWSCFNALVLIAPVGLVALPRRFSALLGAVGGVSGLFTLIVGHAGYSAATKEGKTGDGMVAGLANKALILAAPLAVAAMVAGLSLATSGLMIGAVTRAVTQLEIMNTGWMDLHPRIAHLVQLQPLADFERVVGDAPLWLTSGFLLIAAAGGWLLSRFIDINHFSLHSIYRNRLVRAYLGASNSKRDPNPFTGFDPADNLPLQELRDQKNPALPQRPLHIVNMALNLVSGENLAWQQRKAETFTASTLHSGNYRLGYRFTKQYALNFKKDGLSIGTALAISGAAASPNQGYHSSPVVALLMTLFNVRLGWWLGNPGALGCDSYGDSAPRSPVRHLVKEALGLTDNTSKYVYLSDGGHFENLGLYEMVLRRARLIVVSDAGCDPDCSLEDLGNAIRKIRVDLGVKISFQKFDIYSRDDEAGKKTNEQGEPLAKYCAVGEVDYGAADPGGRMGIIIYLKPALLGREARDIYNYARSSFQFPHEPTSDQWFSESQFESYRALGQRVVEWIYSWKSGSIPPSSGRKDVLDDLVKQACTASETGSASYLGELFEKKK